MAPTTPVTATVTQRVIAAMQTAGATDKGLAKDSGIARSTLQRRLTGRSSFTIDELDAIATTLGIPLSDLVLEDGAA